MKDFQKNDPDTIYTTLKTSFKGYRVLNASLKRILKKLGFQIIEGGKHYKILHHDSKYPVILSKTSSDSRVGMNFVHELRAAMYAAT